MWTYRTQRLVPHPIADVRAAIDELVRSTWSLHTSVTTTEHHGTRSDWIATDPDGDELDVVLSWTLSDLDQTTFVRLCLDELDTAADPRDALEEILDLLAASLVASR